MEKASEEGQGQTGAVEPVMMMMRRRRKRRRIRRRGKRKTTNAPYLIFQASSPNNMNFVITLTVGYKLRSRLLSNFLFSTSHRVADVTMYVTVTPRTLCRRPHKYTLLSPWSWESHNLQFQPPHYKCGRIGFRRTDKSNTKCQCKW